MLDNQVVLITGGTGSLGQKLTEQLLLKYPEIKKIIIFSRDELKQFDMSNRPLFREFKSKLRFFIGDVRDSERLTRACETVDYIIHAAALKQVPTAEYNPMEFIKTNIWGAENVINAAFNTKVKKVVALSTDKAAAPINLYGATKLCSDKLFIAANNVKGSRALSMSVVRYGNVMGSRGSVIPFFIEKRKDGILPITDEKMTRFNISLEGGVDMVIHALQNSKGGEVYIPKIPSYKITDLANAIAPNSKIEFTGIRPGEKLHEEMITESDSLNTIDCGNYYVILPSSELFDQEAYIKAFNAKRVPAGFKYNSGTNNEFLSVAKIRELIKEHVTPNFEV